MLSPLWKHIWGTKDAADAKRSLAPCAAEETGRQLTTLAYALLPQLLQFVVELELRIRDDGLQRAYPFF